MEHDEFTIDDRGCDVKNMNDKAKEILMNKEMIAINQDIEVRQSYDIE